MKTSFVFKKWSTNWFVIVVGFLFLLQTRLYGQPSVYTGAFVHSEGSLTSSSDWSTVTNFETSAGKAVSIINYFENWDDGGGSFPTNTLNNIRAHGSIPLLTWQPEGTVADTNYTLAKITAGNFDTYINTFASAAKKWGYPFFLRFAHEMNGNWYPWSESINGNSTGQYVPMWQHVHDIFTVAGATNVTWVWCVSTEDSGAYPIDELYPGDNYVDWISLDSYNRKANPWQDFSTHSTNTLDDMINMSPGKPIMVAEAGCCEKTGYSKGQWFTNSLANYLKWSMPRIKAWCYFNSTNQQDGNDWRITTSTSSLTGYEFGIELSYYTNNNFGSITTSPIQPLTNDATSGDTMAPFVSIFQPSALTISANTTTNVVVTASDKSGIVGVNFYVNGAYQASDNVSPYSWSWAIPSGAGKHLYVTAKASDGAGHTMASIVYLTSQ